MGRSTLQVADIVREHRGAYEALRGGSLPVAQSRVLDDIVHCRTAFHGGHLLRCNECGHEDISYNSCRNRHCPKCQAAARVEWLAQREKELLPVQYFHVVFTVPREIAPVALQNRQVVYDILLQTSAETLRKVAARPKYLGAEIGILPSCTPGARISSTIPTSTASSPAAASRLTGRTGSTAETASCSP